MFHLSFYVGLGFVVFALWGLCCASANVRTYTCRDCVPAFLKYNNLNNNSEVLIVNIVLVYV